MIATEQTSEIRVGSRCFARVHLCGCKATDWLECVRVDQNSIEVVQRDPVWHLCKLTIGDKTVEVRGEAPDQQASPEMAEFLLGLSRVSSVPLGTKPGLLISYSAGDLAKLLDINPRDVLDATREIAWDYWHPDEPKRFDGFLDVVAWSRRCSHGIHLADVEINFVREGHEQRLAEALGIGGEA